MAESQADRLKKELRFLKESYEAGIISEEEFKKGKKRIEDKLAEWGEGVVEEYEEDEHTEVKEEEKEEVKEEPKEEQGKIEEYEEKENDIQEIVEKKPKKQAKKPRKTQKKEIFTEEFDEENKTFGIGKLIIIVAAILVAIFLIKSCVNMGGYSVDTDLVILNDERCDVCDTKAAENVIERLFPGLTKTYVDYNTKEGKAMYRDLGIEYLPAYVFKDSIEGTDTWQNNINIRNSFEKRKEYYVLRADQTGSEWKP
ncbi:hypothetical protein KY345_03105 [Candidatus Woesearchaeota archaeon]|nr:hypothetical protein [Candidatus Woesearchaeota archaeon]